ncbi:hypothetical protein FGO68_gene8993 [Halteria grandinella]|uniref:Uncharacterized protein n=1 Tax=Halteria grandinella TaxID=5974 RepID=A0A8J8P0Y7_HALGN|nr:hypothetical protein FGO68_gene8993 [Halteria grandinella]
MELLLSYQSCSITQLLRRVECHFLIKFQFLTLFRVQLCPFITLLFRFFSSILMIFAQMMIPYLTFAKFQAQYKFGQYHYK